MAQSYKNMYTVSKVFVSRLKDTFKLMCKGLNYRSLNYDMDQLVCILTWSLLVNELRDYPNIITNSVYSTVLKRYLTLFSYHFKHD